MSSYELGPLMNLVILYRAMLLFVILRIVSVLYFLIPSSNPSAYYTFSIETVNIRESIHLILKWKKSAILNLVTGITLNSLLILLIKRYSSAYLGNYKYLLGIFALFDNYLCTLHGLLNPVSNSRG